MMMSEELTRLRAELKSMGAPGDYGYGTDTGKALMLAHRIMAVCHTQTARAEAALLASSEEARQFLRERDAMRAEIERLRSLMSLAHSVMRECGWQIAVATDPQGDGILEAACTEIEAEFANVLWIEKCAF